MSRSETTKTVIVAGTANLLLAITKLGAGVISGSSAMMAEGAHSVADTLNQGFLFTSLQRSARPPDRRHPFGHGNDRYFWSLLAAFGIFVAGGGYSIFEGALAIAGHERGERQVWLAFTVLGVAAVLEGTSLVRALVQARKEARGGEDILAHVRRTPDVTFKAALFEDTAAMIGLALAAAGLGLRELTGSSLWDGLASILIGLLLVAVAFALGRDSRSLLIGQAVATDIQREICEEITSAPGVTDVSELFTMYFGPEQILVAAKVAFADEISADAAEDIAGHVDRRLRQRVPGVRHVFLDPTQSYPESGESRRRRARFRRRSVAGPGG